MNFRRAVVLMSGSSFLVPLAGVLTQPVLARALGATGRGEMMAAIVPAVLAGSVATLGLPDALTYLTAKRPHLTRRALAWAASLSVVMGLLAVLVTWVILPFLSGDDAELGRLMLLAMVLSIPTLVVGALRGAAMGLQMWGAVAVESLINTALRVVVFVGLWITGDLTPLIAVVVTFVAPAVAAVVYWPLLRPLARGKDVATAGGEPEKVLRPLVSYGYKTWFGSVAGILGATIGPILMTPLASVRELGLYSVASTVMDVPVILALAVANALRGVNSKSGNPQQVARTSRVSTLLALLGCTVLAVSAPWWIPPLFGAEFADAVVPTQLLFIAALLYIPGPMAGAGLAAAGRPGLRSAVFAISVSANITGFVLIVPHFGITGACLVGIGSAAVQSLLMVLAASRVLGIPARRFVVPGRDDVALIWDEGRGMSRKALGMVLTKVRGDRA